MPLAKLCHLDGKAVTTVWQMLQEHEDKSFIFVPVKMWY